MDIESKSFLLFYLLCKYRFKHFSQSDIIEYQNRKIKNIAKYAAKKSDFFRKHYQGHNLDDPWSLPTVDKKMMMENLSDYNTLGLKKAEILEFCLEVEKTRDFSRRYQGINIGMSSGTSGNKGVELVTKREEAYMKAALLARFDFPKHAKINLAFILRVSAPAFNLNKFGHKLTYISQLNPIEEIIRQLQTIKPNIISAPPSMLKIIAQEVEAQRLVVAPKRLVSYAEVLYPDVKIYLQKIFNCPIREIYKCTEGPIAISCRQGSLHLNEDLVAVETLNSDGSVTPPGQPCQKLIVTDLHKTSQPIIRYELNDIVTISRHKCSCGSNFRVIENIQGRADDMFWGIRKDNQTKHFIFQDYISRAIISTSDEIEDFQAIQKDFTNIILRIKLKKDAETNSLSTVLGQSIKNVFVKYNCIEPDVEVLFADPLPNKNSHKLARIICEIKI
jgi:putative adenylate-forming enzyme